MSTPIQLIAGSLPAGTCWGTPQDFYNLIFSLGQGLLPGSVTLFNYGHTEPVPDLRSYPWIRARADGSPDRVYLYFGGGWVSRHAMPPGAVMMWEGTLAQLIKYDGNDSGGVLMSDSTGPMWEEVTEMRARSPIAPGALPSALVIAAGDNLGEEKHTQTIAEMPAHTHTYNDNLYLRNDNGFGTSVANGALSTDTGSTGGGTAFNVIHPVRGIYFIRRTSRIFYTPEF